MRSISKEEKHQAISEVKSGKASAREVAFRLGLPENLVNSWVNAGKPAGPNLETGQCSECGGQANVGYPKCKLCGASLWWAKDEHEQRAMETDHSWAFWVLIVIFFLGLMLTIAERTP